MMRRMRRAGFGFQIVPRFRTWVIVSAVALGISALSLGVRQLNLGLEFKGGTAFQVQAEEETTIAEIKAALAEIDVTDPIVQRVGDDGFMIQTGHLGVELQQAAAEEIAQVTGVEAEEVSVQDVGPTWGRQITSKALRALIIFLIVAVLYISLRMEFKMAAGALVALFHDMLLTAGIYSLLGFAVTPSTVIALLTILGYSLYDTMVIFDRVKERSNVLSASGRVTYSDMANDSLNQVLVRSINTSITSLLPVGSLLFVGSYLLGAETLRELALALFVGMATGTYSSIFVATPFVAWWKEKEPRWATLRARIAARSGESAGPRAPMRTDEDELERAPVPTAPGGVTRPQGRPPRPRGKKKRRRR